MRRKMAENDDRKERLAFKCLLRLGVVLGVIGLTLIVIGCVQFRIYSTCTSYDVDQVDYDDYDDRKIRSYENERYDPDYDASTANYQERYRSRYRDLRKGFQEYVASPPTYRSRYRYDRYRNRWEETTAQPSYEQTYDGEEYTSPATQPDDWWWRRHQSESNEAERETTAQPYNEQTTDWFRSRYRNPWEAIREYTTSISPTYRSRYRYDRYRNRWAETTTSPPTTYRSRYRYDRYRNRWDETTTTSPPTTYRSRYWYDRFRNRWDETTTSPPTTYRSRYQHDLWTWWLRQPHTDEEDREMYTLFRKWMISHQRYGESYTVQPTTTSDYWWSWSKTEHTTIPWWNDWLGSTTKPTNLYEYYDDDYYQQSDVFGFDFTYCTLNKIDLIITFTCGALFLGIATVGLLARKHRGKCMFVFLLLLNLSSTVVAMICTVAGGLRIMKYSTLNLTPLIYRNYAIAVAHEILLLLSMIILIISHLVMLSRPLCCKRQELQHQYGRLTSHSDASEPPSHQYDCKVECNAEKKRPEMMVV